MKKRAQKNDHWLLGASSQSKEEKQAGFILIMFLLLVLMIGLFAMTLHDQLSLTWRTQQNYAQGLQQFYAVEAVLSDAEIFLLHHAVADHTLYSKMYAGYRVIYYFKQLMTPFCFQQQRAYYYRITAYLRPSREESSVAAITLQTTYARVMAESCQTQDAVLDHLGRSAWREQNHSSAQ